MKLPNSAQAIVERGKIQDYLLNPAHPDNAQAFRHLAETAEVAQFSESPHGKKYVILGRIESPDGKAALVKTIWIVDTGLNVARLVTAYPHKP